MKRSKVYMQKREKLAEAPSSDPQTALALLKKTVKDWESVDLDVRLNVNTRKADQNIRGTTILPAGTGRSVSILVLCKEDKAEEAKEAGADYVGLEDMVDKIMDGWTDFDMVIATPDVMKDISKAARVLGPRGLMPNPKAGTVTQDIKFAVEEGKAGKIEYRADKTGIVHVSIGRGSFSVDELKSNFDHLMDVLVKARPASIKGIYIKSIYLSSTQSPSIRLDVNMYATV